MYAANMTRDEELLRLRNEATSLRKRVATLERVYCAQKSRADRLEELLREEDQLIKDYEKQLGLMRDDLEELKRQRELYKGMIYKPKVKKTPKPSGGRLTGHVGYGRKLPRTIDRYLHVAADICPDCGNLLARSNTTVSHTVEDIPEPAVVQPTITRYEVERQWCTNCRKEVVAKPAGVIAHSRLGINLVVQILSLHYRCRMPYQTIVTFLYDTWGITITRGALIGITKRTRDWFGNAYYDLLSEIRAAPVKHADETGWRIDGVGAWVWAFMTKDCIYYTIEQTRGKGVPKRVLAGSKDTDVLVRDDYGAYAKLPLTQQSCWAHLLRKSHEALQQREASGQMKKLQQKLKALYKTIERITDRPFKLNERRVYFQGCRQALQVIINANYSEAADAQKIQTRVRNQGANLLTAILKPNVPLTNNLAERMIRPMVVTRKISGGSRSIDGASSHAVNMSILQTILLRQQPLHSTLKDHILQGSTGKN